MSDDYFSNDHDSEYWDDVYFEEHQHEYSPRHQSGGSGKGALYLFLVLLLVSVFTGNFAGGLLLFLFIYIVFF